MKELSSVIKESQATPGMCTLQFCPPVMCTLAENHDHKSIIRFSFKNVKGRGKFVTVDPWGKAYFFSG